MHSNWTTNVLGDRVDLSTYTIEVGDKYKKGGRMWTVVDTTADIYTLRNHHEKDVILHKSGVVEQFRLISSNRF